MLPPLAADICAAAAAVVYVAALPLLQQLLRLLLRPRYVSAAATMVISAAVAVIVSTSRSTSLSMCCAVPQQARYVCNTVQNQNITKIILSARLLLNLSNRRARAFYLVFARLLLPQLRCKSPALHGFWTIVVGLAGSTWLALQDKINISSLLTS